MVQLSAFTYFVDNVYVHIAAAAAAAAAAAVTARSDPSHR
jgi:hypothetical protein